MTTEVSSKLKCHCGDVKQRDSLTTVNHSKCACNSPKMSTVRLPPRLVSLCLCLLLLSVICVAAFKLLPRTIKPTSGKGLEFRRIHKGPDENDLDEQLKKSDPFIDDFVPTEYTDYLAMKPKELLARQVQNSIRPRHARAVDSSVPFHDIWMSKSSDDPENEINNSEVENSQKSLDDKDLAQESTTTTTAVPTTTTATIAISVNQDFIIINTDELILDADTNGHHFEEETEPETETETDNDIISADQDENNEIEPSNEIETETSSQSPVTEGSNGEEVSLEVLRDKLKFLESRMGLDAEVLVALNKTLTIPQTRQKIYQLFLNLVTKLEEKELNEATTTTTTATTTSTSTILGDNSISVGRVEGLDADGNRLEVVTSQKKPPLVCGDIQQFKIFPQDSPQVVRKKQGHLMRCYMDENVDPCDKFYEYACGKWANFHPIPKDKGGYDIFEILREDMDAKLIQMLEAPIDESDGNATAAVKALYTSCMNTEIIEGRKETPLLKLLRQLGGWPVVDGDTWNEEGFDWQKTITKLREFNNDILVALWVGPDGKDSDDYIFQFDQSDLLLPSAEYYLLGLGHPIMQTYYNLLVNVATLLGAERNRAKREMKELIEFEIELAAIMIPPHERRNYSEIYLKLELGKLSTEVPDLDFYAYLSNLLQKPINSTEEVVIYAIPYFKKLTKLMKNSNKRTVSNYVLWRFIRHRINNLDTRFLKAQQELYRRLYGREETPPRKKFCVAYVNGNLGNSVGALFVKKYFDEQSKEDMEALTDQVQMAFHDLVMVGGWLSNDTKKLAETKIRAIIHNIGYPDFILDDKILQDEFFGLTYQKDEFFENVLKNLRGRTMKEMRQLDERVNRTLWTTTPAVVNAYYSRNRNQIMFPAGILQPPFYHKYFPKSLNFGGIGVVIGHEITHGFDDKGRQFDHIGNINQWWDHISSVKFQEKAQCIIDQYNNFNVEEVGIFLNGLNTQGENIADNGGIKQSYHAYQNWLRESELRNEGPLPGLEHLNDNQLFFLNFAQVWCGATRPEALRSKIKTAVHAPGKYRVYGTLSNSEEFAKAFNCPRGSKMNPESKCSVW